MDATLMLPRPADAAPSRGPDARPYPCRAARSGRFDPRGVRGDFPALGRDLRPGVPLTYLDSAATALRPWPAIRAVVEYDAEYPANVHRGLHALSERATEAFEAARGKVARFIGAAEPAEVVFTPGTTAAINLVAQSWGRAMLKPGDEVVLSELEHHSNLVPWQLLAEQAGVSLKFADLTDDGQLDLGSLERQLSPRTRLVAVTAMSNVTGAITPLGAVIDLAHRRGAVVVVDAAQGMAHLPMDVRAMGADFVAFSGHKLGGPTGIGVLYGRRDRLEAMPPAWGGGGMVGRVTRLGASWAEVPERFEAGTPPIAQAIGLGAAVDYLGRFDREAMLRHEQALAACADHVLGRMPGVRVIGPEAEHRGGVVAFTVEGAHPHDLAQLLDREGVAIRAGHHCAMPLHDRLGLAATARASFFLYNTADEVDRLSSAVERAREVLRPRRRLGGRDRSPATRS